jgi:hydroxyacylglutathione hydrolase
MASLDVHWIHGSANCATSTDPRLQVHRFDENTYILRQDKCLNFEAPFLYLMLGSQKALLLDTGAEPPPQCTLPVRDVVQQVLRDRLGAHAADAIELTVGHSHSHADHVFGDRQFVGQARTTVVAPTVPAVQSFFGLVDWPNRTATLDLGGRVLTIIPIPGHEAAHIAIYDENTRLLLTGDTLYPGLLTVRKWPEYRRSIDRLAVFASTHAVSWILGAHVEMTRTPTKMYPLGTIFQPDEHVLQLGPDQLNQLHAACEAMGDHPHQDVHDEFIIQPL